MTKFSTELINHYQVRKTRKQKEAFRKKLTDKLIALGYPVGEERHGLWNGTVNVTVGDPDSAEYVFTAHYDTCAIMPFPNFLTPRNPVLYWGWQILLGILMVCVALLLQTCVYLLTNNSGLSILAYFVTILAFIFLLLFGPSNRHTANDNTSGVCVLCEALQSLSPEELKNGKAAFVFFDNEEKGLIGSLCYKGRHKKALKTQTVINFDCVGDGDQFLFVCSDKLTKKTEITDFLTSCIVNHPQRSNTVCSAKKVFYPSDQMNFAYSVGVAAFRHVKGIGLYMGRIHTRRDTVLSGTNLELLKQFIQNTVNKTGEA